MTVPITYLIIIALAFLAGVFSTHKKRGQIFCWFEGEDGTNEHKWVKNSDGWVIFRGYKYKIMTERITTIWLSSGIHYLFPTRASCLSFVWYSQYPRNPKEFGRTAVSPKVRKIINLSELMESYFKTSSPSSSKGASSFLSKYGALIAIALVIIAAFYLNNNMQNLATGMNHMQNQINTMLPR